MTTNSPMHTSTSPLADPHTVQKPNPVSWADMNDDDEFDFPVINLAKFRDDDEEDAIERPAVAAVQEEAALSPAPAADRSPAAAQRGAPPKWRAVPSTTPADAADGTPKRNRIISADDAVYTVPAKVDGGSHGPRSSEKRTVAREGTSGGNHHSPSRALLPAFVQITVESTIPYALRSSAASSQNDLDGVGWSSLLQSQNVLEALAGPEKAARKCRSEVRRTKAVQLLREALVSAPEPIPCDDLAKLVGWNRKFRPAVGCLFSFLKKHRDQFAYSKGAVSLVVAQPGADSATNVAQVAAAASITPEIVRGA